MFCNFSRHQNATTSTFWNFLPQAEKQISYFQRNFASGVTKTNLAKNENKLSLHIIKPALNNILVCFWICQSSFFASTPFLLHIFFCSHSLTHFYLEKRTSLCSYFREHISNFLCHTQSHTLWSQALVRILDKLIRGGIPIQQDNCQYCARIYKCLVHP